MVVIDPNEGTSNNVGGVYVQTVDMMSYCLVWKHVSKNFLMFKAHNGRWCIGTGTSEEDCITSIDFPSTVPPASIWNHGVMVVDVIIFFFSLFI